eukprot:3698483-Rhodomonas_salina.1
MKRPVCYRPAPAQTHAPRQTQRSDPTLSTPSNASGDLSSRNIGANAWRGEEGVGFWGKRLGGWVWVLGFRLKGVWVCLVGSVHSHRVLHAIPQHYSSATDPDRSLIRAL